MAAPSKGWIFLAAIPGLILWAIWPSGGQVSIASCAPNGVLSSLSAVVFGKQFWRTQLDLLERNAQMAEKVDPMAEMMARADAAKNESDARLENLYREHPEIAPTPAQKEAERLRAIADKIEADETLRKFAEQRQNIVMQSRKCYDIIADKLDHMR